MEPYTVRTAAPLAAVLSEGLDGQDQSGVAGDPVEDGNRAPFRDAADNGLKQLVSGADGAAARVKSVQQLG